MKEMMQRFFEILKDSQYEQQKKAYAENQTQLQAAFAEFAEQFGLEAREAIIRPYHYYINAYDCVRFPFELFIKTTDADIRNQGATTFERDADCPVDFLRVCHPTPVYTGFTDYLRQIKLRVVGEYLYTRFIHRCASHLTYFQDFILDGTHYGSVMAPPFNLTDEVREISGKQYYSMLLKYIDMGHEIPVFSDRRDEA